MQNGFSPYEAETQEIDQRRKYAELLRQQGMTPIQAQSVGGMTARISPLEGLAKMLNAYSGSKGVEMAGQERKALADKRSAALLQYGQSFPTNQAIPAGTGATGGLDSEDSPYVMQGGVKKPTPQDYAQFLAKGAAIGPDAVNLGSSLIQLTQKDNKPFSLKPGEVQYDATGKPIVANTNQAPEKGFKVGDVRKMRVGRNEITQEYQPDGTWKEIAKGDIDKPPQVHVAPAITPVTIADPNDPNKKIIIDGRTGAKIGDAPSVTPEKALPTSAAQKLMENQQNLRRAEQALDLINGKESGGQMGDTAATGWKGYLPDAVLQRTDPSGIATRAAIGDLGSLIVHDRSGAAVTAAEFPRLRPFIPSPTDDPQTVKKKLERFVNEYRAIVEEASDFYKESGYKVPTQVLRGPNGERGGGAKNALTPQDTEALAWANANPNDPRSAEIKKRLGAK